MNYLKTASALLLVQATASSALALTTNITSVADTGLFENNPTNNLGGMVFVPAGTTGSNKRSRALFKFDIAGSIPAGATVSSASLSLTVSTGNGFSHDFELHRVLEDWGEGHGSGVMVGTGLGSPANAGDATWNARLHPDTLWSSPGGGAEADYIATASAVAKLNDIVVTFTAPGLAADVQSWLDDPDTNFGWLLKIDNETPILTATGFATREDTENPPALSIEYDLSAPPSAPRLFDIAQLGGEFLFSFNGESNRTYTVEYKNSLMSGEWDILTNVASLPADMTINIASPISEAERYFRASTP